MTAILQQKQQLDAKLAAGEISAEQHAERRAAIIDNVEIVEVELDEATLKDATPRAASETPNPAPASASAPCAEEVPEGGSLPLGIAVVVSLGVVGLCIFLALITPIDIDLAMTIAVTALAVLTVRYLTTLED